MIKLWWALLVFRLGVRASDDRRMYIVQKTEKAAGTADHSVLASLLATVQVELEALVYQYDSLNAFAAPFTLAQAEKLGGHDDVLAIFPDERVQLHTTRTPEFLGLNDANLFGAQADVRGNVSGSWDPSDMVIGVVDTGAWPESESYNDAGMPAIPAHWKGECVTGEDWTASNCNKKLIGAKYFYKGAMAELKAKNETFNDKKSARDQDGHGTHTSSTAAGAPVRDVSSFGLAPGMARGMAPTARIAVYKVCWLDTCTLSDMLAGMDAAIQDGVDVLSISLGCDADKVTRPIPRTLLEANKRGIFVSMSAGNDGPDRGFVGNTAPWLLTVGASTIDREFPAIVTLGNGVKITGRTGYTETSVPNVKSLPNTPLPFISGAQAAYNASGAYNASLCCASDLDPKKVAGKIVLCLRGGDGPLFSRNAKGAAVRNAGGRGFVLSNDEESGEDLKVDAYLLPGLHVGHRDGKIAYQYVNTTKSATATISFQGTKFGAEAPKVAAFSSRGPVFATLSTLKPDILAPGVNVLAAYSPNATLYPGTADFVPDPRRAKFFMISGTSMACPHMAGLAAVFKARHRDWSPAAIRSAFVTTAYNKMEGTGKPIADLATGMAADPYAVGGGHVNFSRALNPGLVYDASHEDYVAWACTNPELTAQNISYLANDKNYKCKTRELAAAFDLNEPSFGAIYDVGSAVTKHGHAPWTITFRRTATSVGGPGTYQAALSLADDGDKLVANATVSPKSLTFAAKGDRQSYTVTVTLRAPPAIREGDMLSAFGSLTWSDGTHLVRSPMAFSWGNVAKLMPDLGADKNRHEGAEGKGQRRAG